MKQQKIAIIGAGIAGLTLARELQNHFEVTIFEKSRGVGGRIATRKIDKFEFDHGAQCFTTRTSAFKKFIHGYEEKGLIKEWQGRVVNLELGREICDRKWYEKHLVFTPSMNNICKEMAKNLNIVLNTEVLPSLRSNNLWHLQSKNGNDLGKFNWVVCCLPSVQSIKLVGKYVSSEEPLKSSRMYGCFSLMIGYNKKWQGDWIAAKVRNNPLKWISVNSTKPMRNQDITCFVAHSKNNWSDKHLDDDIASVQQTLLTQFEKLTRLNTEEADHIAIHRWRYAIVKNSEKRNGFVDVQNKLAIVSDWCRTSRIEEVWQASMDVAERVITAK